MGVRNMSMPEFPKLCPLTREQALTVILTSIALEELALSHIINAEGEKIQYAVEYTKKQCNADALKDIKEINLSVATVLEQASVLEELLLQKMQLAHPDKPPCRPPEPPCPPPKPPCAPRGCCDCEYP